MGIVMRNSTKKTKKLLLFLLAFSGFVLVSCPSNSNSSISSGSRTSNSNSSISSGSRTSISNSSISSGSPTSVRNYTEIYISKGQDLKNYLSLKLTFVYDSSKERYDEASAVTSSVNPAHEYINAIVKVFLTD